LSWLITELLVPRNRHILERLRQEVNENFGSSESGIALTFESLKASTYLQWVFLEGNRLYPALTVNARLANKDTVLPAGGGKDGLDPIAIRKGTRVNFCKFFALNLLWGI
jgi:cytochrome P450